jgi:hypothetical protein
MGFKESFVVAQLFSESLDSQEMFYVRRKVRKSKVEIVDCYKHISKVNSNLGPN